MNTELVQEYAARKGLALPEGLDLEISDYSDSDVFTDGGDDEGAGPSTVIDQEAGDESDEALLASQLLEDIRAAGGDVEGRGEDEDAEDNEDDGEGVHLNDEELDDVNALITQVAG
jgi:hypothetical protein